MTEFNPKQQIIAGAVARGWCHKVNEKKVMDIDLAGAIVDATIGIGTTSFMIF